MNFAPSRATSSSASASAKTSDPVGAAPPPGRAGARPKEAAEKGSGVNEEDEGGDRGGW